MVHVFFVFHRLIANYRLVFPVYRLLSTTYPYLGGGLWSLTEIPSSEMPACLQAFNTSATR